MKKKTTILFFILATQTLTAQSIQKTALLNLLETAEKNYPLLKSKKYEIEATRKNIDLVKNTALPSLDASYQMNLATSNNLTGMFYSQGLLPITGPPSVSNNFSPTFGSAASLLLNWQPISFGQREAEIKTIEATLNNKIADNENEIFKHKISVVSNYLDILLSQELLKIFQKNIDRSEENLQQASVLVNNGLRSGVDTALFKAELSKARVDFLVAKKTLQNQEIYLTELLAKDSFQIQHDSSYFQKLPIILLQAEPITSNLLVKVAQTNIELNMAKQAAIKKSVLPKLNFWATTFGRGSGVSPANEVNNFDGLLINRLNYGMGAVLTMPLLKAPEVRLQLQQQEILKQSLEEQLNQTTLQLNKQSQMVESNLKNALQIAQEMPVQVSSATYGFKALRTRYGSGLVTFTDLIQAQYNLAKAETDLRKSYWEVWKTLLYKAAITGNLDLFLNQIQ